MASQPPPAPERKLYGVTTFNPTTGNETTLRVEAGSPRMEVLEGFARKGELEIVSVVESPPAPDPSS
jgi:hypothetical protein